MKQIYSKILNLIMLLSLSATAHAQEKIILLNEGNWQSDNGRITYFEDGHIVSNQWFRDVNGKKLGDTPNDIIQVRPNLIAIAVNWSNIIQFIDASGHAVAETEDVPNNRKLATDGEFLYVTSYAHECLTTSGMKEFTKGFVAKIDVSTFKVVDAVEVGYEPEGIAVFDGHLFVANSGGYAFQENHEYGHTISVIDKVSMTVTRTVNVEQINLYGKFSQSGQYLCISSPGDYYEVDAATIILDCQAVLDGKADAECFVKLDCAATYSTTATNGNFYAVGSAFSYITGNYEFNYLTINPGKVITDGASAGVEDGLPGTLVENIKGMASPYGIYVNPFTGYIYATDAAGYAEGGTMYQWTPQGTLLGKYNVYINPGHFLALNPYGEAGVEDITFENPDADTPIYNLQGIRIDKPLPGQIFIKNGRKQININQ